MRSVCYLILICLLIGWFPICLSAQNDSSSESREFDDFREELQGEYDGFRKEINAVYADFLSKAWKEYRLFEGKKPDKTPKPLFPILSQDEKNTQEVLIKTEEVTNSSPIEETESQNLFKETSPGTTPSLLIDYFGAKLQFHYQNQSFRLSTITERLVGNLWRDMAESRSSSLLAELFHYKETMQMNDWAYFLLTKQLTSHLSGLQNEESRIIFQHFLLVQSGYDARLARVDRFLVLLLPILEKVYARPYLEIDGKTYYVLSEKDLKSYSNIFTYQLPKKLIRKPYVSLMIHKELVLPMLPKPFCIKAAGLEVKGEVNSHIIHFYQQHLSCELPVYARAATDARLSKQLITSLAAQINKDSPITALNQLLAWVQKGFHYQTDGQQFGYEKPFFIEENFYYPASDCEDRAILFAYLVRNLLKKKVVLLDYPGHVATAVCMEEEFKGAYILLNGKRYIVCDPTYVNAKAGNVMPSCRGKEAKLIKLEK